MHIISIDMEKEWASGLHRGDKKVFDKIYQFYWKKLLAISYKLTKDKDQAEEIVQDVFISLWQRRNDIMIDSLSAYLATAVKFATFKALQRQRQRDLIRDAVIPADEYQLDEEKIDARFLKEYLDGVVETLPERCKLVFQMSREDYKSHEQIACELHISEKAVEANITRALKVLRVNLRKVGFSLFLILFF